MDAASSTAKAENLPSFGFWLGLLAVGLTLNVVTGFARLFTLEPQSTSSDRLDVLTDVGVSAFCALALFLLLGRRKLFVPIMISILIANVLLSIAFVGYEIFSGYEYDLPFTALVFLAQCVVAGLWTAYLLRSKRVREVCVR